MKLRRAFGLVALLALALPGRADIDRYLDNGDDSFAWQLGDAAGRPYKLIEMTSQTWRGIAWKHSLTIFLPQQVKYPDAAVLFITGGTPGEFSQEAMLGAMLANAIGAPFAILWDIPNQPLFDNLNEDALIAYTFAQALQSREMDWPLLFPMAKSAVRAMDALQAWSEEAWDTKITRFITAGASKRGWTTWFTGAIDPRVVGIMPMVYDNLDLNAQMRHQIELWGRYSPMISDYTERGLQELLGTDAGAGLGSIVDPFTYRDRITMPKLIINGTNDAYWTLDALNLYRDQLSGQTYQLYVPNSGHGLQDITRVLTGCQGFVHQVFGRLDEPTYTWDYTVADGQVTLTITAPAATTADLWTTTAPRAEFTDAEWKPTRMTRDGDLWRAGVPVPATGYLAVFGEATFELGGVGTPRSTTLRLVKAGD